MTDQSKNLPDSSIVLPTRLTEGDTSEENNSGIDKLSGSEEEKTEKSNIEQQIGLAIEDLQNSYLPILNNMAKATFDLRSWLHSKGKEASPTQRRQLLSALDACLNQSAIITGLLQVSGEEYRSPIMIVGNLKDFERG